MLKTYFLVYKYYTATRSDVKDFGKQVDKIKQQANAVR